MYINTIGHYVPSRRIANDYFAKVNGLSGDWIEQRTGILSRSRAAKEETMEYMCLKAIRNASTKLPYNIEDVDLIIFASYTPDDTIATIAHIAQREFGMTKAKSLYVSSACSSAINAMEIVKSFFTSGIASKALVICADRNSSYSDDSDCVAGHLWGDAAVACFFSKEQFTPNEPEVLDITTQGLGHIGVGPQGVFLNIHSGGLQMPNGRDVFVHACKFIAQNTKDILAKNQYSISDLSYFIAHQANERILNNVCRQLELPNEKSLANIKELGNTGSASAILVFSQNYDKFNFDDLVCISVFGGGYSAGTCLVKF